MNVHTITMRGFRSYDDQTIKLPTGTIGIVGANGAGKSTLMEAICFGLFGPEGGSVRPYVTEGAEKLLVELSIEHRDRHYRIRRSATGTRTALDFDVLDETSLSMHPLTQGNQKDTQAKIEQLLGVNRTTFLNSVFLRQNEGGNFAKADRRVRRELLADALGLDVYDRAHDTVAADRRAQADSVAQLEGRAAYLADGLDQLPALEVQVQQLAERVPELEQLAARRLEVLRELEESARQHSLAEAERGLAAARVLALDTKADQLAEAAGAAGDALIVATACEEKIQTLLARMAEAEDVAERLNGAREQQRLHDEAMQLRQRYIEEAARLTVRATEKAEEQRPILERIVELEREEGASCDRCGQHLHDEARARAFASLEAECATIRGAAGDLARQSVAQRDAAGAVNLPAAPDPATVRALEDQAVGHQAIGAELAVVRERHANAVARMQEGPSSDDIDACAREQLEAHRAYAALPDPAVVNQNELLNARTASDLDAEAVRAARERLAGDRALLEQLHQRQADLAATNEQLAAARHDLEVLSVIDEAFGPAGVPAWIVEHNAIPQIEEHANRVLDRLGGAVRRVELRTERELAKGGSKATLDVVCHTDQGARDFQTFSGGEMTRADIALRLGLASLLSSRSSECRLLMMDEPGGLDAVGMDALVSVLRDEVGSGRWETVMVSSHVPQLQDAFDRSIACVKDNGVSRAVVC